MKTKIAVLTRLTVFSLVFLLLATSCKKGDEDPFFSIYSRKHRLCQDWKFSYFKRVEQNNQNTVIWEYDGTSLKRIASGNTYISAAKMSLLFSKNGTYVWNQEVSNDTSDYVYNEEGTWYFSGGGKDTETQYKELLTMQKNKVTETLSVGSNTTVTNYQGSGDLNAAVFKIIKLASDEVKLFSSAKTTYVSSDPNQENIVILTIEIKLRKNL